MKILTRIAIKYDCGIDVPHHPNKLASTAGDANSARGASSFVFAARLVHTLFPMTPEEAKYFGIAEEERRRCFRVDSAKVNIAPATVAIWFKLVSVRLGNATADYPAGDSVQVAEPWTPPDLWTQLPIPVCNKILDAIENGLPDGDRFSDAGAAKERAVWPIVQEHAPTLTEQQCRKVIKTG